MPAIQGSQLYTNEATYTILSSLADQTTKGGISTTASKEYIFLIIGCIGGALFAIISVFIFMLWRKYTRVRGYSISPRYLILYIKFYIIFRVRFVS